MIKTMEKLDNLQILLKTITELLKNKEQVIIAIDGRCASGKTTLANQFNTMYDCNVFRMDDFFLRSDMRTISRLYEPGGNVDYERFRLEVLEPLKQGRALKYRPYCCQTSYYKEAVLAPYKPVNIVEGSYACHPALWNYYDYRFFMNVVQLEQMNRLQRRNPNTVATFRDKWIPLEERYFYEYHILERCDSVLEG